MLTLLDLARETMDEQWLCELHKMFSEDEFENTSKGTVKNFSKLSISNRFFQHQDAGLNPYEEFQLVTSITEHYQNQGLIIDKFDQVIRDSGNRFIVKLIIFDPVRESYYKNEDLIEY